MNAVNAKTLLAILWNAGAVGSMSMRLRHAPGFNTLYASRMTSCAADAGSSWKVRHELTRSWESSSNGMFSPAPCWNLTLRLSYPCGSPGRASSAWLATATK